MDNIEKELKDINRKSDVNIPEPKRVHYILMKDKRMFCASTNLEQLKEALEKLVSETVTYLNTELEIRKDLISVEYYNDKLNCAVKTRIPFSIDSRWGTFCNLSILGVLDVDSVQFL